MTLDAVTRFIVRDGRLTRWLRDAATVPGAVSSVTTSNLTATSVLLNWAAPANDGGSPITGYVVSRTGGSPVTVESSTLSYTFTGLTASTSYTLSVSAVNAVGTGPATTKIVTTLGVDPPRGARFPGDPQPKLTGHWYFGIDERDADPTTVDPGNPGEFAAPETLAGVPVGSIRRFFNGGTSDFAVPTGKMITAIRRMHTAGRLPWVSELYGNWAGQADGRNNTGWDAFIRYVEEQLAAPVGVTLNHEPENQTIGIKSGAAGTEHDYGRMQAAFRSRMDVYANAHGGVGVYKWKNLFFGPIFVPITFTRTGVGNIDNYWRGAAWVTATASASTDTFTSNAHLLANGRSVTLASPPAGLSTGTTYFVVQATSNTFKLSTTRGGAAVNVTADATGVTVKSTPTEVWDTIGADPYQAPVDSDATVGRTGVPVWGSQFAACVNWCEDSAHTFPLAVTEWGVHRTDGDAGTQLVNFVNRCLDGTHDIWMACYFNGAGGSTRWSLQNDPGGVSNARLLDKYVAEMQKARSIHFWDVGYARPGAGGV